MIGTIGSIEVYNDSKAVERGLGKCVEGAVIRLRFEGRPVEYARVRSVHAQSVSIRHINYIVIEAVDEEQVVAVFRRELRDRFALPLIMN